MKWEKKRLGDVCKVSSSKRIFFADYVSSGVPFYRSKEIIEKQRGEELTEKLYISRDVYENYKEKFGAPRKGDILLTSVGTLGISYICRETDEFYFKDGNLTWFHDFLPSVNSKYIHYWFKCENTHRRLDNIAIGSSQKALTIDALKKMDLLVPDFSTQCKIINVLERYDSLIENNRRQIKLLEEAAQRLYKEWFVDLRFPGHEQTPIVNGIPQGWSWVTYGDVIEFNPKVQLSKNGTYLKVPMNALSTGAAVVDMACCERTTSTGGAKFENGDTLFARITPCLENGKTGLWYSESYAQAVGSTEFIVMRSRCLNPYMVYSIARTEAFRQMAQGTFVGADGRQRAQADKMQEAPYLRPEQSVIQEHQRVAEPLMQRVFLLNRQNALLAEARDRLLPKLMGGEVEV